jgi:hypothetical protein
MNGRAVLEQIETNDWYAVKMDGFDEAIAGYVGTGVDNCVQLVYSYDECIAVLMDDMSEDDAVDYFSFNCYPPSVPHEMGPPPLILETGEVSQFKGTPVSNKL